MKRILVILICLVNLMCYAQLIFHPDYADRVQYDTIMSCPSQVIWSIRTSDLGIAKREPQWRFVSDVANGLPRHADYNCTGYDRGHLCPAADRSASLSAMRSTFVMSNVAPQTPKLNRGLWKMTEDSCRLLAYRYEYIQVLAMPVFINRDTTFIGRSNIGVPHAFFKAAWLPQKDSILAVWFMFNK